MDEIELTDVMAVSAYIRLDQQDEALRVLGITLMNKLRFGVEYTIKIERSTAPYEFGTKHVLTALAKPVYPRHLVQADGQNS